MTQTWVPGDRAILHFECTPSFRIRNSVQPAETAAIPCILVSHPLVERRQQVHWNGTSIQDQTQAKRSCLSAAYLPDSGFVASGRYTGKDRLEHCARCRVRCFPSSRRDHYSLRACGAAPAPELTCDPNRELFCVPFAGRAPFALLSRGRTAFRSAPPPAVAARDSRAGPHGYGAHPRGAMGHDMACGHGMVPAGSRIRGRCLFGSCPRPSVGAARAIGGNHRGRMTPQCGAPRGLPEFLRSG